MSHEQIVTKMRRPSSVQEQAPRGAREAITTDPSKGTETGLRPVGRATMLRNAPEHGATALRVPRRIPRTPLALAYASHAEAGSAVTPGACDATQAEPCEGGWHSPPTRGLAARGEQAAGEFPAGGRPVTLGSATCVKRAEVRAPSTSRRGGRLPGRWRTYGRSSKARQCLGRKRLKCRRSVVTTVRMSRRSAIATAVASTRPMFASAYF